MSFNKVMLITGATSGIGKSLAEHFYKKKYKLILTGSSEKKTNFLKKKFKKKYTYSLHRFNKSKRSKIIN